MSITSARGGWRVLAVAMVLSVLDGQYGYGQAAKTKPNVGRTANTTPASTAPPTSAAAVPGHMKPVDKAKMKALLAAWEKASAQLNTLDVGIQRLDKFPSASKEGQEKKTKAKESDDLWPPEEYKGRAIFKKPNLVFIDFKKITRDDQKKVVEETPHERIIGTGNEFWQYLFETKEIYIFPDERKPNQPALEEGPLPFLFNMKASEVEARYTMSVTNETAEYYAISVIPKLQYDQKAFARAFIKLDRASFFPSRVVLFSPDGKSTKDYNLFDIRRNQIVDDKTFKGVLYKKPWEVRRDILNDQPASASAAGKGAAPRSKTARPPAAATKTGSPSATNPTRRN